MAASGERAFVDALYTLLNNATGVGGAGVAVLKGDRAHLPAEACVLLIPKDVELEVEGKAGDAVQYDENPTVNVLVEYVLVDTNANFDEHADMAGTVRGLLLADETLGAAYDRVELGTTVYAIGIRGDQLTRRATIPMTASRGYE